MKASLWCFCSRMANYGGKPMMLLVSLGDTKPNLSLLTLNTNLPLSSPMPIWPFGLSLPLQLFTMVPTPSQPLHSLICMLCLIHSPITATWLTIKVGFRWQDWDVPHRYWDVPSQDWDVPHRHWDVPSQDWDVPHRYWDVPSQDWDVPHRYWDIPTQDWDIPFQDWDIPHRYWDIPDLYWDVPSQNWDVPMSS